MKPHRSQYWLTNEREKDPEQFDAQVETICELYAVAAQLSENESKHIISNDEMTGIQALERKHPTRSMGVGKLEKREFEYIRHGTQALIASFNVGRARSLALSAKPVLKLIMSLISNSCGTAILKMSGL